MPEFDPTKLAAPGATAGGTHGGLLMAQALKQSSVDTIFGVCGGHILGLLDGCIDEDIRVIDCRHEGAASLAAEGWALATGRVGFAAVTAGPGFGNALTGLIDAGIWTVPLVLFAGRTGLHQAGRGAVMDVDQRAMASVVAKWAATCYRTDRIPHYVAEALYRARAGRPGAVYLEVPQDVFMAEATPLPGLAPSGFPATPPRSAAAPEDLERALDVLRKAERPIAIAGGGAYWSGAADSLARFAEVAKVPVTTTSTSRGLLPDSHPWCVGTMVHGGIAVGAADVVLVLGSAFNANLGFGLPPLFSPDQTVIQVDIRPEGIGGNRLPEVAIVGDVDRVLRDLADGWTKTPEGREAWLEQARGLSAASLSLWDQQIAAHSGREIHAGALARDVAAFARDALGDGVTFVADGGDFLTWGLAYTYAERPGHWMGTTTALGTLGVGIPFANAAAAARPDTPVILLVGDGSFGLSAMEIDTAARHGLHVIAVVSNNHSWGDVRHEQRTWYGEGRTLGSELASTRYDRLGEALGAHGEHVTSLEDLRPALERSLASGGPAVVNVETDPGVLSELLRNLASLGLM